MQNVIVHKHYISVCRTDTCQLCKTNFKCMYTMLNSSKYVFYQYFEIEGDPPFCFFDLYY